MSKELQQYRCNSFASAQIGESKLSRKAKAYARKCAFDFATKVYHRPLHEIMETSLLSHFIWSETPQGHKFWMDIRGVLSND